MSEGTPTGPVAEAATPAATPAAPAPPTAKPRRPIPAKSTHVDLYGMTVPREVPRLAIEMACYRENRGPELGGLGAEEHFKRAFRILWPKYEWSEWVEEIIAAYVNFKWVVIIGHQRASKTFTVAHCALLDYICWPTPIIDPKSGKSEGGTLISLATVTFEGLKLRMWADLLRACETCEGYPIKQNMQIRSTTNEMKLCMAESSRESGEKFMIHGMAVNQSQNAEGRIRGGHAERRRIILDEAQNIADPIFEAIINPMSAPDAKAVLLTNPVEKISKFGEFCEPEGGWSSVDENTRAWKLKKFSDGVCLHLNGLESPNVKANKAIFTGLLTNENVEEVRRSYGENSVQWWSLILGFPPPDGMVSRVFPASAIDKAGPKKIFDFRPELCMSLDPAFEYDACIGHIAELGRPIFGEKRYAINCLETVECKFDVGPGSEPKDYQLAHWVMKICKDKGISPLHFIIDGTGGGRGVVAILQKEWSQEIQVVLYGGAATERPLRGDNQVKASDLYRWFVSELWFRASECCKDGLIGGLSNLNTKTKDDLFSRRYEIVQGTKGTLQVVETKSEVKKRLGRSPDYGDAFVQFGELLVRLGTLVGSPARWMPNSANNKWQQHKQRAIAQGARVKESKEFAF